jgi:hypothetical protein
MRRMTNSSIPILWMLTSLLTASVLVTSAVLLLREATPGPWLMLVGSSISLLGVLGNGIVLHWLSGWLDMASGTFAWFTAVSAFSFFGHLLFAIGLLLHALSLRGRADRIAELEAILRSRDGNH